jgi:hypothetical protein
VDMIARRRFLGLAAGGLAAGAWPEAARADDAFVQDGLAQMYPLLIDLPGWSAKRPTSVAIKKFGGSMSLATREYQRGDAIVVASVTVMAAVWTWRGMMGRKAGRADPIGEPDVQKWPFYDTFGMVRVTLAADAQFGLQFQHLPSAEAIELARRFDWKAIQAALPQP